MATGCSPSESSLKFRQTLLQFVIQPLLGKALVLLCTLGQQVEVMPSQRVELCCTRDLQRRLLRSQSEQSGSRI